MAVEIISPGASEEDLLAAYNHGAAVKIEVLPGEKPVMAPESGDTKPDEGTGTDPNSENTDLIPPEGGGGDDAEDDTQQKPKRKGGFQRTIDTLKRQNDDLTRRLAELQQLTPNNNPTPATKPAVPSTAKPKQEDFDDFDDFIAAMTEWGVKQELEKRDVADGQRRAQQTSEQQRIELEKKITTFKATTPDFDEVVSEVGDVVVAPMLQSMIVSSPKSAEIIYHLAKNPDQFENINDLPPLEIAKAFGVLEAQFTKKPVVKEPTAVTKPTLPKPVTPVDTKTTATPDPENMSLAEYRKYRETHN